MSYDENDAAYDRFVDELYKEFRESALDDQEIYDRVIDAFREARLRDYYVDNPRIAESAQGALDEAETLVATHPRAALILAVVAIEVCLRDALLTPILHGSFHTESAAEFLVRLVVGSKDDKLTKALLRILTAHTGIDLQTFKRLGALRPLWVEMDDLKKRRNIIIHQADVATTDEANLAIQVAKTVVDEVFVGAVRKLGFHLHNRVRVCGANKCPT